MNVPPSPLWMELRWLSGLLLGSIFLISGTLKIFYWRRFTDTFAAMEILPPRPGRPVFQSLPAAEIALGGLVIAGWQPALTGPLLLALLCAFVFVLVRYRWRGGKELACGCFADFERRTNTASLILRNGILLLAGIPLLLPQRDPSLSRGWREWTLAVTVVFGSVSVWHLAVGLAKTISLLREDESLEYT